MTAPDAVRGPPIALAWLRRVVNSGLPAGPIALAAVYVTYMDANGDNCRPGDRLVASQLVLTPRTVKNWRRKLVRAGLLECARPGRSGGRGGGPGRAAEWRPVLPVNEGNEVSHDSVNGGHADARMRGTQTPPHLPTTSPTDKSVGDQPADRSGGEAATGQRVEGFEQHLQLLADLHADLDAKRRAQRRDEPELTGRRFTRSCGQSVCRVRRTAWKRPLSPMAVAISPPVTKTMMSAVSAALTGCAGTARARRRSSR